MNRREEFDFDKVLSTALRRRAEGTSRRTLTASMGRILLTALGFTFIPNLPVDRLTRGGTASVVHAFTCSCSDPELCGLYGKPCCACSGGGCDPCSNSFCPPEYEQGLSAWTYCCNGTKYQYWDCCYVVETQDPPSCSLFCSNNPNSQPAWCQLDLPPNKHAGYGCTIIKNRGAC